MTNESLTEDIIIEGVGEITHPDGCTCAGEVCDLEVDK
jgi:hypothetical protein